MGSDTVERLNYYERQFLGADDLRDQQAYHRDMRRRHNVGHHTWGIVSGLKLIEDDQGGQVEVIVQPGMAVDGYGREIVLLSPLKLEAEWFLSLQGQHHREVWIAFDEELANRPHPGYELCEDGDQLSRIRETAQIIVGPEPEPFDPIIVDGTEVETDAEAAVSGSTARAVPDDRSVPEQDLPDEPARWLVRLGSVNWDGAAQAFLPADPPERLNELRPYIGIVTEDIYAPDKSLTLRDRRTPDPLPAGDAGVAVGVRGTLTVDRLLTAKDDIQIHGGKLDLRDTGGLGQPYTLQRVERASGKVDLKVTIGDQEAGENRLVVGPQDKEKVTIADNGDTEIQGNVWIRKSKTLQMDGGRIELQTEGSAQPQWALRTGADGDLETVQPADGDRLAFEILHVGTDPADPVFRLHGEGAATLSAEQLIDLTDGGVTTLHTHTGATTIARGMVEIASPGETSTIGTSGVRVVVPADDTRLLTNAQKTDLTDGGLTTLHRHPNGILNNVFQEFLRVNPTHGFSDIVTVSFASTKRVVAMINLGAIDPEGHFRRNDAIGADIMQINGVPTPGWYIFGGDHWGSDGSTSNLRTSIYTGTAQSITFRLRSFHHEASARADAIVFYEDL